MLRLILTAAALCMATATAHAGELLYNGIQLPDEWPPRPESFQRDKFSDGVCHDPGDRTFKMWYMAGTACFFESPSSRDTVGQEAQR